VAVELKIKAIFKGVDRMTATIGRVQSRMKRFTSAARRGMKKVNRISTKVASTVGRGLVKAFKVAAAGAVALGAAVGKIIKTGADFEQTMVSATVKLPGNIRKGTEAYEEIEKAVLNVGETTEFSATQSAEALKFLAMAGFTAEQSMAALPAVVDLATAAEVDLATASDIATDTLGAMGMEAEKTPELLQNLNRVMDVMSATSVMANTSLEQMFENLKKGGPIAKLAGADIETYGAVTAILAGSGLKASEAGTAMRTMFKRLNTLTPQGAKALKKYGVELKDGRVAAKDFAVAMKQLEDGLGDMEGGKKINILSKVFGDEGATAAAILIDKGNKKLVDMRKELQGVQGKSKEMAAAMRDTTSGAIKKLESAIAGVIISLFKLEGEGIEGVIKGLTKWIGANKELIVSKIGDFLKDIRDNFDQIISTLKTAGVVIGIIFGIIGALKAFTAIMTVVNLVMMANPIVLIVMAIIAAVALAAFLIVKYWDDIVAGYWWLVGWFEKGIEAAVRIFEGFVDGVVTLFEIIGTGISDFFGGIADALVSAFNFAVDFVKGKIQAVLDFFQPVLDTVREVLGLSEKAPGIAAGGGGAAPRVVSPQDRTVASLEERRMTTTNRTEVTLRDETGRAQVTRGQTGSGFNLQPTGSF
jgi:TP901 family phage tail tape measure protein